MISPNPASPNGTRARILILLTKNGPMTTAEIAEALGLTPKQVRDNSNQARHEDLIASGRDDVTGTLAYSITPAGRDWVKALLSLGKPLAQDMTMLPKADSGTSEEPRSCRMHPMRHTFRQQSAARTALAPGCRLRSNSHGKSSRSRATKSASCAPGWTKP